MTRSRNYFKCQSIVQRKLDIVVGWRQLLASISTIFSQTCQQTPSQVFWNPEKKCILKSRIICRACYKKFHVVIQLLICVTRQKKNRIIQQSERCETANTGCLAYFVSIVWHRPTTSKFTCVIKSCSETTSPDFRELNENVLEFQPNSDPRMPTMSVNANHFHFDARRKLSKLKVNDVWTGNLQNNECYVHIFTSCNHPSIIQIEK